MVQSTSAKLKFTRFDRDHFRLPDKIAHGCDAYHGKKLTLLCTHSPPTNVTLEQRAGSFFISKGWKTFTQSVGLRFGQYIRLRITSSSTLDVLMFDKDGASKLPLATSSNHQMKSKASKYIHQPSKGIVIREGPPKKATVVSSTSTEDIIKYKQLQITKYGVTQRQLLKTPYSVVTRILA
ncbi:hypothetical protein [Oryza sativa Japonica Group]|uniref:Uncharacterized protein n=2 Tax=Oryza sativa subsp. japonica TaxID=39947 RepID=Q8RZM3_ORYSJ|nr:hypothetical protein [Oryza sativa Japonica Group]BAB91961.1 hypothetical protein [Oryza sativa Japonica Group]